MRELTRILFSLRAVSCGDLESHLGEEIFQIVGDLSVEAIQMGTSLLLKAGVGRN